MNSSESTHPNPASFSSIIKYTVKYCTVQYTPYFSRVEIMSTERLVLKHWEEFFSKKLKIKHTNMVNDLFPKT